MPCTAFAYMSTMTYLLITSPALRAAGLAEQRHDRIVFPDRIVLPHGGRTDRIALLRIEPSLVDRLGGDPRKEIPGGLLLLGIAHQHVGHRQLIRELAGRTFRQCAVQDI